MPQTVLQVYIKFIMDYKEKKDEIFEDGQKNEAVEKVRELVGKNRGAALGLAVFLALSTSLAGCGTQKEKEDEEDSYYTSQGVHGGGYFYSRGSSFTGGSWSTKTSSTGAKIGGYSSTRGGSIGG